MEQRAATTPLQRTRSWLVLFSSAQVFPAAFISASVLLRQVCFGRPTLRFPCGFQSRACLVMLDAGFRGAWPIQLHFRFLISVSIRVCFVLSGTRAGQFVTVNSVCSHCTSLVAAAAAVSLLLSVVACWLLNVPVTG